MLWSGRGIRDSGTEMEAKTKKYEIDMCRGPLFSKIVLFALPLMLTYVLQLLFNAADLVVIGNFAHPNAMAAIGATMNLNGLVINVFIGLSVGTNVLVARLAGAKDPDAMRKAVHTSMAFSLIGGVFVTVIGFLVAKPLLILMRTPTEILPLSCTYIWICFSAIPFIMVYNFGCAILRAVGDTRRPLIFLITAGIANVILNLFFVIVCGMDVAGVALATMISHGIAATLIVRTLMLSEEKYGIRLKDLGIDWQIFREILKIGIPAGIQSSCFAVSNMMIQASINTFGAMAMAGTTVVQCLEGMVYVSSIAFHQTTVSFVAQNLGGRKYKRILKSFYESQACAIFSCSAIGFLMLLFARPILTILNPDPEVIRWGLLRMEILFTTYGLCGLMDVASGGLRGLGYSLTSTTVSLLGACVFRIWWVWAVFPHYRSMENLLWSYPISWLLVGVVNALLFLYVYRKLLYSHCAIATPFLGLKPGLARGFRYLGGSK